MNGSVGRQPASVVRVAHGRLLAVRCLLRLGPQVRGPWDVRGGLVHGALTHGENWLLLLRVRSEVVRRRRTRVQARSQLALLAVLSLQVRQVVRVLHVHCWLLLWLESRGTRSLLTPRDCLQQLLSLLLDIVSCAATLAVLSAAWASHGRAVEDLHLAHERLSVLLCRHHLLVLVEVRGQVGQCLVSELDCGRLCFLLEGRLQVVVVKDVRVAQTFRARTLVHLPLLGHAFVVIHLGLKLCIGHPSCCERVADHALGNLRQLLLDFSEGATVCLDGSHQDCTDVL